MTDPELSGTQLPGGRGKQLVFLFMMAIVAAVVIFLLGVSVGRGVRQAESTAPGVREAGPAGAAAPDRPVPADLSYHETLRGGPDERASRQDTGASAGTTPRPRDEAAGGRGPAPDTAANSSAAAPPASGPPATGQFTVQIGAYATLASARLELARVTERGYEASIVTLPASEAPRYRVIVGPFSILAEATRAQARLKQDGFGAIIKR